MPARQTIVGLDFGSFSIKAAWLEKRGALLTVLRTEELQLPPETQDPVRFITPWLEKHGIPKASCAIAVPGAQTVFQPLALAPNDPRTAEQASEMEVASFNDMAGEHMSHSAVTFEWTPGARQMLMAMVRPGIVDKALRGAAAFSLRLCELMPSPVAAFNAVVRTHGVRPAPTLFVNIGHAVTDVAVGTSNGLLFARSFAIGGKSFTDAILKARGGMPSQAERAKRTEASLDAGSPLAENLQPVANLWLSQLKSTLAVYRGQFTGESFAIGDVVLSGGGSQLRGLEAFVAERLGLPASVFADPAVPAGFATAYGLALAGARAATCPLSLLPQRMRDEIVFGEKKPYWVAAGICASLTLAVFIVSGVRGIARERAVVDAESKRIKELRRIDTAIKAVRGTADATRELGKPVLDLLQSGPIVRELVTLVANSIHPDDWITMICDEAVYLPPPPPEATNPPPRVVRAIRDVRRPPVAAGGALGASPGSRGLPVAGKPAAAGVRPAAPSAPVAPSLAAFIIEGYTPTPDLATVKDLIRRLLGSDLVVRADVLGDERVLPAALLGDTPPDELTRDLTHFVVRVEVNRP
jgi:Tfp pilus assembly PilM family ATPase